VTQRQWHQLANGAVVPGRVVIGFAPQRIVQGEPPTRPVQVQTVWPGSVDATPERWWEPTA
jgi:hypothetical protein